MSKDALPFPAPPAAPVNIGSSADVVAIVVNYGTADLALEAVESLLAQPERLAAVHLIDNASPGGDGMRLAEAIMERGWQGHVTLWAETVNHGFGRGNNLVIDALLVQGFGGKVLLLNPDAHAAVGAVATMAEFLDDHPSAGAVGARIEKPGADGIPCPVTAAFRFPSLVSVLSDAVNFGPLARLCAAWAVPMPPELPTEQVDWVSGAAVMFRLEALKAVGSFDPDFFLYFEEVELMHRMKAANWEVWHVNEALVIHSEGAATGVRADMPRRPDYWYKSWRLYMEKTLGRNRARSAAVLWLTGAGLRMAIAALRRRNHGLPGHFFRDVATHVMWPLLRSSL